MTRREIGKNGKALDRKNWSKMLKSERLERQNVQIKKSQIKKLEHKASKKKSNLIRQERK